MRETLKTLGYHAKLLEGLSPGNYTGARTEFQIRHFVVGQHPTRQRQWSQLMCEIRAGGQELARRKMAWRRAQDAVNDAQISVHEASIEIDRAKARLGEIGWSDWWHGVTDGDKQLAYQRACQSKRHAQNQLDEANLALEFARLSYQDKRVDVERLCKVAREYVERGENYSDDEIEQGEPEYWYRRLSGQAFEEVFGRHWGVSAGNVRAIINAGFNPQKIANLALEKDKDGREEARLQAKYS